MAQSKNTKPSKGRPGEKRTSHLYKTSEVVLPWENEDDFNEHLQSCRNAFNPEDQLQEEEVFGVACLYWKNRRCNVSNQQSYFNDLPSVQLAEAQKQGPEAVRALVDRQAAFKMKLAEDAATLAKANMEGQVGLIALHKASLTPEEAEELRAMIKYYEDQAEMIKPLLKEYGTANPEIEREHNLDSLPRNLKLTAEIDRQIDKKISRLANLKEFRRLYGKAPVNGSCIDVSPRQISLEDKRTVVTEPTTSTEKK